MSQLNRTREQRWLPIHVECTLDEQADSLIVRLINGGSLPTIARAKAVERVIQIIEDLPDSSFVKYLRENASIIYEARRVTKSAPPATGEDSWRMDLARTVAKMLHQEWSNLEKEAAHGDLAEQAVLEMLLDDIRFIADWGAV